MFASISHINSYDENNKKELAYQQKNTNKKHQLSYAYSLY
jgi:hypothetical protein